MYNTIMYSFYQHPVNFFFLLVLVSLWSVGWEGFGLWYSAENKQKGWFIAVLLIPVAGLLPIIYLLWFKPKRKRETPLKSATKSVRKKK